MMSTRMAVGLAVMGFAVIMLVGCQRGVIIEGGPEEAGQPELIEGEAIEEGQAAREREEIEASLQTKKYAGIEGEVFESSMLKDLHFAFDRYDLNPETREILAQNADFILRFPEAIIQIEGHCDERGTNEYNLALGERRATSAKRYLLSLGVPVNRLSTISYGEELPLDPRHGEDAWARNRRAHFVILSK